MAGPRPATNQRSPWIEEEAPEAVCQLLVDGGYFAVHRRNVHDGQLVAIVAEEPIGWHMSISHPRRYPAWDEITHARYLLLPDDIDFVMHLPPPSEYVALHDNCFHLHEHPERPA